MAHGGRPSDGATCDLNVTTVAGRIWLVRHAPTEWTGRRWCGRSDPELTEAGRAFADRVAAQIAAEVAAQTAAALTQEPATGAVVMSSPLRRALDTAGAIARALEARVKVESDLVEVDFGAVDGLTWDELVAAYPALSDAILAGSEPDWPGGETAIQVATRARSIADRILDVARTTAVVVVSHGCLLPAIARHLGGDVSPDRFEPGSAHRLEPVHVA
jgi:broad specificity phosphatase PhoE